MVTEERNDKQEDEDTAVDLKQCNYPAWSIHKVTKDIQDKSDTRTMKNCQEKETVQNSTYYRTYSIVYTVTVPYVQGLSEACCQTASWSMLHR